MSNINFTPLHCNNNFNNITLFSSFKSPNLITRFSFNNFKTSISSSPLLARSNSPQNENETQVPQPEVPKKLSKQSSWEAKDSEGNDYLYRLGKESDNMNIAVGARAGVIDDLFTGQFLGRDCKCLCTQ